MRAGDLAFVDASVAMADDGLATAPHDGAANPATAGFQIVKLPADDSVFEVRPTAYVGPATAAARLTPGMP